MIPSNVFGLTLNQRYRSFGFNFDLNYTGSHLAPVFENDFPFRTAQLTFDGYTKADFFGSYQRRLSEGATMLLFVGADNIFQPALLREWFPGAWDCGQRWGEVYVLRVSARY